MKVISSILLIAPLVNAAGLRKADAVARRTTSTDGCCGWHDGTHACSHLDNSWCQAEQGQCTGACGGIWYAGQTDGATPTPAPVQATAGSGCCGWNDGTNACSQPTNTWCHESQNHCSGSCNGIWYADQAVGSTPAVDPTATEASASTTSTETCPLPSNMNAGNDGFAAFSLITKGDACVGAHNVYSGVAVGGTLSQCGSTSSNIAIPSNTNYKSYVKTLNPDNSFGWQSNQVELGVDLSSVVDFSYYEGLAQNAKHTAAADGSGVHVVTQGGTYNLYDFVPGGQGENNGATMVIFNTSEDIILTKTHDGRQFGPIVIAPFSHVNLHGDAGFVDGFIVAGSFATSGNDSGLQMHGNGFTGTLECEVEEPDPTPAPTTAATPAPTFGGGGLSR